MRTLWLLQFVSLACAVACAGCRTGAEGLPVSPLVQADGGTRVVAVDAVEPRLQPALEALQAAVNSGDDREARAVLASYFRLEPSGRALELGEAFERILDGRAAVAALEMRLDVTFEREANGAGAAVVQFVGRARDARTLEVAPGPAVLHVKLASIDAKGDETKSLDTQPISTAIRFKVSADAETRFVLARLPFALPRGSLAARASFDLELRSGVLRENERELPAMHLHTETGELVLLARELSDLELATDATLADLAASGKCNARTALAIAVRIPRTERASALDRLSRLCEDLPETAIGELTPALRWLAPDSNLGEDAPAWRAWLRMRARALESKPDIILPRPRATKSDGS